MGTGIYVRVGRENLEIEECSKEERAQLFAKKSHEELMRWLEALCMYIVKLRPPQGSLSAANVEIALDHVKVALRAVEEGRPVAHNVDFVRAQLQVAEATLEMAAAGEGYVDLTKL